MRTGLHLMVAVAALTFSGVALAKAPVALAEATPSASARNMAPPTDLPPAQSTHDPRPTVPSPVTPKTLKLVQQAGIGSQTSYARGGVLELGGNLGFTHGTNHTILTVSPSAGIFLTDNFQLSGILGVSYQDINGHSATNVSGLVEPSVHLPITDQLFAFGGLGVGVAYHQGSGTGFALAPRVGFNVMVGRSGILTPAFNVNWSSNSAIATQSGERLVAINTLIGASLGYSVMW